MLFAMGKIFKIAAATALVSIFILDKAPINCEWENRYYGDPMTLHETCPICDRDLTLQEGFYGEVPYWVCKGCKETLVNPFYEDYQECLCCPNCEANLEKQEGFSKDLQCWRCKGCGECILNEGSVFNHIWICHECGAFLNEQYDFSEKRICWKCRECGNWGLLEE